MRKKFLKAFLLCFLVAIFISIGHSVLAAKPGANKKVFFIHHSTGQIYWKNGMRSALVVNGYTGKAPWWNGNTDPGDFLGLFFDPMSWVTFNNADIIIFKSCFPSSSISSKVMLRQYKVWYKQLFAIYNQHPNILFVPMSTPPLPKNMTNVNESSRAMQFDEWLATTYITKYNEAFPSRTNLLPYRLHLALQNRSGYLAKKYVADLNDGHPNALAGKRVGNTLAKVLNNYFAN